jgi:hypothetical protein
MADSLPLDPKVKAVAEALAKARGPISSEQLAEIGETLKGLEPARAEQAAVHLVALGLKLFKTEGEAALEVIAQLYVLATLVLGEKGAAQAFEQAINYAKITGTETARPAMVDGTPEVNVKGKLKRGLS